MIDDRVLNNTVVFSVQRTIVQALPKKGQLTFLIPSPTPASFCFFSFVSSTILQKNCIHQRDLNSYCRSRRWARWPIATTTARLDKVNLFHKNFRISILSKSGLREVKTEEEATNFLTKNCQIFESFRGQKCRVLKPLPEERLKILFLTERPLQLAKGVN